MRRSQGGTGRTRWRKVAGKWGQTLKRLGAVAKYIETWKTLASPMQRLDPLIDLSVRLYDRRGWTFRSALRASSLDQ